MIFLDSSFLVAYYNDKDEHRKRAIEIMDKLISGKYGNPYISDYVFDEVVTVVLVRTKDKSLAITVGDLLRNSLEIVNINEELFDGAWNIFKGQKNTSFGFTDSTILAVMQKQGMPYIATFDEDFEKVKGIKVVGVN